MPRPILRYHGGKNRLAKWVTGHFPEHIAYVEPFCGAASVLLAKAPSRVEVINDLDDEVVNLLRILRNPYLAEKLREQIELTPYSRTEFNLAYERHWEEIERARRLIVRSFQGVGANAVLNQTRSGWRIRTAAADRNAYSVDWSRWPDSIPKFVTRLKDVQIECSDYRKVIEIHDFPDTLFYVDPPYPKGTRSANHRHVYFNELTDEDHVELCNRLAECKGYVVLSSYLNPIYDEILGAVGWKVSTTTARAQTNQTRIEALYINPRCAAANPGRLFEEECAA